MTFALGELLAAFVGLALVLSATWCQLSKASIPALVLLFAGVAAGLVFLKERIEVKLTRPDSAITPSGWLIGLLLPLPVWIYFLMTVRQEFPFSGDHDHHMYMSHIMLRELGWIPLGILLSAVVMIVLGRKWPFGWLPWLAALLWGSTYFPSYEFVSRYPAALYTLASPLNAVLRLLDIHLMVGTRLANVLSIPVWLWVVRPLCLGRWPDVRALLLGVFFFQRDFVHFSSANYLEPWSLILSLTSLELLLEKRTRQAAFAAAAACMFKEQAVFLFAVCLAAEIPWREKRKVPHWFLTSLILGLPFLIYWTIRKNAGIFRNVSLISPIEALEPATMQTYFAHLHDQLGWAGWIAILILLAAFAYAFVRRADYRWILALLLGAIIAPELLYLHDVISREYLGYFRFHMLNLPLVTAGAFLLPKRAVLAVVCAALFMIVTVPYIYGTSRPDYTRNYVEYYAAPVFFPIGKLLAQLPPTGIPALKIFTPVQEYWFKYSVGAAYGHELSRFVNVELSPELKCACELNGRALLLVNVYQPVGEPRRRVTPIHPPQEMRACLDTMRTTCEQVIVETAPDGAFVGAAGYRRM